MSEANISAPCLTYALTQSKKFGIDVYLKEECVQCILVKAGINAHACQEYLIEAQQMLEENTRLPRYLEAAASHRHSLLAHLDADYTASNACIDSAFFKPMTDLLVEIGRL